MKTVGVVTIHRILNHGSVLQALATCRAVAQCGYEAKIIDYRYPSLYHLLHAQGFEIDNVPAGAGGVKGAVKRMLVSCGLRLAIPAWRWLKAAAGCREKARRFREFRRRFLPLTGVVSRKRLHAEPPAFDAYMTGSDQTWNPRYLHRDFTFLLDFAPPGSPCISYGASFGASSIGCEFREDYARLLDRYRSLSVRESSATALVRDLTGREAEHVLDPTFLLERDEWMEFASPPDGIVKGRYIFCYCLDYVFNPFPGIVDELSQLSERLGCPVVFYSCNARHNRIVSNKGFIIVPSMGPDEFLGLMDRASFVVSTSFHGVAFAVNFGKEFLAVLNPGASKDDRVSDFLQSMGLKQRGVVSGKPVSTDDLLQPIDYGAVGIRLRAAREDSKRYLASALHGVLEGASC